MYCQQIDYVLLIVDNKNIPAYLGVHMNVRGQGVILDLRNANCVGRVVFIIARLETLREAACITKSKQDGDCVAIVLKLCYNPKLNKMAVVWQSC